MTVKPLRIFVVAAALLFAACSLTHKTDGPDDAAITDSIQAKLFQDPALKMRDIRVASEKGVVTLTGTVGSDTERLAVEALAHRTIGVAQVTDQLMVSGALAPELPAAVAPGASSSAPERPRKSKNARRVMAPPEWWVTRS